MNSYQIIWPVLAQVFLTLALFIILGVRKIKALKSGGVDRGKAALNNREWPVDVIKVSNNIANQFEAPILFYVLCLVLYSMNVVSVAAVVLAWLFTLSRCAHAYVHIHSNHVPMRFRLFMVGCLILIAILAITAGQLVNVAIAA